MERDAFEQLAQVAERVRRRACRSTRRRRADARSTFMSCDRDDEDLGEREREPLAQLVGRGRRLAPEARLDREIADELGRDRVVELRHLGNVQRLRQRHLFVEPARIADLRDAIDLGRGRAERRLAEEARRLRRVGRGASRVPAGSARSGGGSPRRSRPAAAASAGGQATAAAKAPHSAMRRRTRSTRCLSCLLQRRARSGHAEAC